MAELANPSKDQSDAAIEKLVPPPNSQLRTLEKNFGESLAHYQKQPNPEAWQALEEAQKRLMYYRLAAGKPISDLLPRMQQALRPK